MEYRHLLISVLSACLLAPSTSAAQSNESHAPSPAARVIAARGAAYDANFHNDRPALTRALGELDALAADPVVGRSALYYASWTEWGIAGSLAQDGQMPAAAAAAERSAVYARRALAGDESDVEAVTMLTNALIAVAVLDRARFPPLTQEIERLRRKALALGPQNPRVVMMHAGMISNIPPEVGGSKEKGVARWLEAIALFEKEAAAPPADALRPAWGRELAYGWLAPLYLGMEPPQPAKARAAAEQALKLRPDFWYVNDQILPKLRE